MIQFTLEKLHEGRRILAISHAFVESHVASGLDFTGRRINVEGIPHRFLVAKKDTRASVDINLGISIFGGKCINAATKDTKAGKVDPFAGANSDGRWLVRTSRDTVVEEYKVSQGIRPVFGRKTGAEKHSADTISNGAVGTFDQTNFT